MNYYDQHFLVRLFLIFSFAFSNIIIAGKQDSNLELLGFRVGEAKILQDILTRLGSTRIWHTGDAAESESKICYRVASKRGEIVIVFASSEEMAAPKGQINSIRLFGPEVEFGSRKNCTPLQISPSKLRTPSGLHLGLSKAKVNFLFGAKNSSGNSVEYNKCQRRYFPMSHPEFKRWVGQAECFSDSAHPYFEDCWNVHVDFKNGHAVFISLNRNQSVC